MKKLLLLFIFLISTTLLCSCEKQEKILTGAWYSNSDGTVYIFSEDGELDVYNLFFCLPIFL